MGAQLQCFGQYPTTFSLARCAKAGALLVVVAAPGLKKSETCAKGVLARALIVSSFVVILCFSAFHSIRPHRARQDAALKRHPERVLQSRGQHAHQKVSIETSPCPHLPSHGCCSSILEVDVGALRFVILLLCILEVVGSGRLQRAPPWSGRTHAHKDWVVMPCSDTM